VGLGPEQVRQSLDDCATDPRVTMMRKFRCERSEERTAGSRQREEEILDQARIREAVIDGRGESRMDRRSRLLTEASNQSHEPRTIDDPSHELSTGIEHGLQSGLSPEG
jgi:hypothetical protein